MRSSYLDAAPALCWAHNEVLEVFDSISRHISADMPENIAPKTRSRILIASAILTHAAIQRAEK